MGPRTVVRPACKGECLTKYIAKKEDNRQSVGYKAAQADYYERTYGTEKYKAAKKTSAAIFNKSEKGKIVKKRAYNKWISNELNRLVSRVAARMREAGFSNRKSKTLMRYTGFATAADVKEHFDKYAEKGKTMTDYHIDHIIPVYWYKWRVSGDKLIVDADSAEEMHCMWHRDNLQLLSGPENSSKGNKLPPRSQLEKMKNCWPMWFGDQLPEKGLLERVQRARGEVVVRF